jgi:hypothetical protein
MHPTQELVRAISDFVEKRAKEASPYSWEVTEATWKKLDAGFPHDSFGTDYPRQNIALKHHLADRWRGAAYEEKIRLATWVVRDWGGIRRNAPHTIAGYVNQADSVRPSTPFYGVASYSKILAIKDPITYAIYDARAAASLIAIQVIERLGDPDAIAFPVPPGQNSLIAGTKQVTGFADAVMPVLRERSYRPIPRDEAFDTYLALLRPTARQPGLSILDVEMFLFSEADKLCREAMGKL